MKAIFNSRIIDSSDSLIKTSNRAFCYGDGLFETIVTGTQRINLIQFHLDRLSRACAVMGIEFPEILSAKSVIEMISKLVDANNLSGDIRAKLTLWRNEGGLYAPNTRASSFYINVKETDAPLYAGLDKIGLSENHQTQYSPISFAKTSSALTYVLAGNEKVQCKLDDIILTDVHGHLSETHIANLFWIIDGQIYTSSLKTGCISGVMRSFILDFFQKEVSPIKEILVQPDELKKAQCIFTTNASGIRYFSEYDGRSYANPELILAQLLKQLQHP